MDIQIKEIFRAISLSILMSCWYLFQLFTVVTHVKQAHEVLEHGETQDFNDELDYIMDGLGRQQPLPVRCLRCVFSRSALIFFLKIDHNRISTCVP